MRTPAGAWQLARLPAAPCLTVLMKRQSKLEMSTGDRQSPAARLDSIALLGLVAVNLLLPLTGHPTRFYQLRSP